MNGTDVCIQIRDVQFSGTSAISRPSVNFSAERDFNLTFQIINSGNPIFFSMKSINPKIRKYNFNTCIPLFGEGIPIVDVSAINGLEYALNQLRLVERKIYPYDMDAFLEVLAKNSAALPRNLSDLPDKNFIYYKNMDDGKQCLFLHVSSKNIDKNEDLKCKSESQAVLAYGSDISINADNVLLDHAKISGKNICFEANDQLTSLGSEIKADETIRMKAQKQRHCTTVNIGSIYKSGGNTEEFHQYISSVDEDKFIAKKVIQEGEYAENYGISVKADTFLDNCNHTVNKPVKTTLYGYIRKEDSNLFGSSETSVHMRDDYLFPCNYNVNEFISDSQVEGSSIQNDMTHIFASKRIRIDKDINSSEVVTEQHEVTVRQSNSGISFCGLGVKAPSLVNEYQNLREEIQKNNNRIFQLRTLIKMGQSVNESLKEVMSLHSQLTESCDAIKLLNSDPMIGMKKILDVLSHYVNPSLFIGNQTIEIKQVNTESHGNLFASPLIEFNNKKTVITGDIYANDAYINTGSLISLSLPNTMEIEQSIKSCGVTMNLLTFASSLMTPGVSSAMQAALNSSSFNMSFRDRKSGEISYTPSKLCVKNKLQINARDGHLSHTQIKAGIIYAIFTGDLVMETLATKKWSTESQCSGHFSLNGVSGFSDLAQSLKNVVKSSEISLKKSREFEQYIDDFAYMIGEDKFYLEVEGIMKTKSVIFGQKNQNSAYEHIHVGKVQNEEMKNIHRVNSKGFKASMPDMGKASDAFSKIPEQMSNLFEEISRFNGKEAWNSFADLKKNVSDATKPARDMSDLF